MKKTKVKVNKNEIKFKLKKNDNVKIMTGKANTGTGRIIRIDVVNQKVYVEGQNLVKKAIKQKKQNQKAGISEIEAAIHISNVRIICKKCGPTRIGTKIGADGKKTRICKKCGDEF